MLTSSYEEAEMTQLFNAGAEAKKSKIRSYVWIAVCGVLAIAATMNYERLRPNREWITIEVPNPPRALAQEIQRASSPLQNGAERGSDSSADR
jgi:hypothetical protein